MIFNVEGIFTQTLFTEVKQNNDSEDSDFQLLSAFIQ